MVIHSLISGSRRDLAMIKFKPGNKVKCINEKGTNGCLNTGTIYTIYKINEAAGRIYLTEDASQSWFTTRFIIYKPKVNHLPEWL